jgi:hypothetical protein
LPAAAEAVTKQVTNRLAINAVTIILIVEAVVMDASYFTNQSVIVITFCAVTEITKMIANLIVSTGS